MDVFWAIALLIVGLILIVKGGDLFVDAAAWMAEVSGIPKFIIGATVVSLATTLPELLVSVFAAAEGKVEMAAGNAIGSVTANIALIMGFSVICLPAVIRRRQFGLKAALMLLSAAILAAVSLLFHEITLPVSLVLILILAFFVWDNIREAKISMEAAAATGTLDRPARRIVLINAVKFLLGAGGIVLGARLLVDNGSALAALAGVSEGIISVTIIAVGTSLPELTTTITAIVKKQSSLSIGNILGANIIDLTLILPASALVSGGALPVRPQTAFLDLPMCLIVGLLAVIPPLISGKFRRGQGVLMLLCYAAYLVVLCGGWIVAIA